jgi:hypothetical protein
MQPVLERAKAGEKRPEFFLWVSLCALCLLCGESFFTTKVSKAFHQGARSFFSFSVLFRVFCELTFFFSLTETTEIYRSFLPSADCPSLVERGWGEVADCPSLQFIPHCGREGLWRGGRLPFSAVYPALWERGIVERWPLARHERYI